MSRLEGKVAIVTGAGQGVGLGISAALAKEGASVVLAGRTEDKVRKAADELRAQSLRVMPFRCDVEVRTDVERMVAATVAEFGTVDILFNNACRGSKPPKPIEETTDDYLQAIIQTNIYGTLYGMQACFPHMKKNGGRIINFSSGSGYEGWANLMSYAATKEAIRAMTRVAAREWGKYKITANVIGPMANSPSMQSFQAHSPERIAAMLAMTPLGYMGDCEADIGPVAVFLASDDSHYITGQTFNVDGGRFMLV